MEAASSSEVCEEVSRSLSSDELMVFAYFGDDVAFSVTREQEEGGFRAGLPAAN